MKYAWGVYSQLTCFYKYQFLCGNRSVPWCVPFSGLHPSVGPIMVLLFGDLKHCLPRSQTVYREFEHHCELLQYTALNLPPGNFIQWKKPVIRQDLDIWDIQVKTPHHDLTRDANLISLSRPFITKTAQSTHLYFLKPTWDSTRKLGNWTHLYRQCIDAGLYVRSAGQTK